MRNRMLFMAFGLVGALASANLYANAEIKPATSFDAIKKLVDSFDGEERKQTLIVMDDDDTLTMMPCGDQKSPTKCQYLGGPAWYSWQSELIKQRSTSKLRVADKDGDLLQISGLLLSMNDMSYTDTIIPGVLNSLTQRGSKLLVLTARGVRNLSATEGQFSNLQMSMTNKSSFLTFISANAMLGEKSGISSVAGPIQPADCLAERPIAYQQGVMYVAGQNKGVMLKCLLSRTQSEQIKNIVFIDDTLQNVEDVYAAFEQSKDYNVHAYHYTKLQAHKDALTAQDGSSDTNAYQVMSNARWQTIKVALKDALKQPAAIK